MLIELNIDALVGPTHHFGGLGVGNVASQSHQSQPSRPREAALEGLRKAELVASFGVPQFVWLPPARPNWTLLKQLGFAGSVHEQLKQAYDQTPRVLSSVFSSAFMWAANSATVTPAADASDGRTHFTPANLISSWHRWSEASERVLDLSSMFPRSDHYEMHRPLPSIVPLRDEGAANHMRMCGTDGSSGVNVFVHGQEEGLSLDTGFFPRHTREASAALARLHQLDPQYTFFLTQHPEAIAAGVFHNDVIATSHQNFFIHHERAFLDAELDLRRMAAVFEELVGEPLIRREVSEAELSLEDAVRSYFFNSQIVSPDRTQNSSLPQMVLICPQQCSEISSARKLVEGLIADTSCPIEEVRYVSLAESMANGGGPACLRLRVPVDASLLGAIPTRLRVSSETIDKLSTLIEKYYPEQLRLEDFLEAELVDQLESVSEQMRSAFGIVAS